RRRVRGLQLIAMAIHRHIQLTLAHIDPGDLRVRLTLFHRPILVASDLKVPATIRVMKRRRRPCSPSVQKAQGSSAPPPTVRLVLVRQADVPEDSLSLTRSQTDKGSCGDYLLALRGRRRGLFDPSSPTPSGPPSPARGEGLP